MGRIRAAGFYDDFPGGGRSWIAPDGPFNEHLVRDVGVLNLALAVVTIGAAVWLTRPLVRATACSWLAYSVPHLVYHVLHRGTLAPSDQVSSLAGLAIVPVLALAVLVVSARPRPAARSRSEDHDRVPVMRNRGPRRRLLAFEHVCTGGPHGPPVQTCRPSSPTPA